MANALLNLAWRAALPTTTKMLLVRLADIADCDGRRIWPSVDRLARECSTSARTIQRALRCLEADGYLSVVGNRAGGRGLAREYAINVPRLLSEKGDTSVALPAEKGDTGVALPSPERVTSTTGKGDIRDTERVTPMSPQPLREPPREPPPPMSPPPDIEPSTPTPTPSSPTPSSPSPSPSPSFAMVPSPAPTPTPSSTPSKISSLKDLTLADDLRAIAEAEGVNGEREMERFRDYCLSKNRRYKDYRAAFRNWLRSPLQHPNGRPDNKRSYSPTETMRRMRERRMIHDGPASFDDPIGDRHRVHGEDADLLPPAEARQRR